MIQNVLDYIKDKQRVTYPELFHALKMEAPCLKDCLDLLERKGIIFKQFQKKPCSGCTSCGDVATEIYEYKN